MTDLIGTPEAARRLGKHRSTFSRLVTAGRITPVIRAGNRGPMLFDPAEVDRLVAEILAARCAD